MAKHHPNSDISEIIEYALSRGWRYTLSGGHAHGQLWCHFDQRGGCRYSVWSTPRSPVQHARWLRKKVDACPYWMENEE